MTNSETQPRVAVVTGASFGIGEATARALASDGYRVDLLARRLDRITALAGELGDGCVAIQADVTDRASLLAAAERVQQELGGADVLVNNAGIMLLGPFDTDQREDYRQMIEVNLLGAITATEVFLDQLEDRAGHRGSDIVNISAVAGRTARAATQFGEGDIRASLPRFEREALEANLALVDLVTKVAERKNATVGQVALAWLLAQTPWIVPIPGTRRLERLDENLGSANLNLTPEDLAELDQAPASVPIQGDRYPEAMQKMIDR